MGKMGFATMRTEERHADSRQTQAAGLACAPSWHRRNLSLHRLRQAFWLAREVAGMVSPTGLPVLFRLPRGLIGTFRRRLTRSGTAYEDHWLSAGYPNGPPSLESTLTPLWNFQHVMSPP